MSEHVPAVPLPAPSPLARHWRLDPGVVLLNHGSFGACPIAVLDEQARLRDLMEAEPVRFFVEMFDPLMDAAREALARLVRCTAGELVFVPNATTAVATVLAHLEPTLAPGDEVLTCAHEYPACLNNLRRACRRTGAVPLDAPIPWPVRGPEEVVDAVLSRVTPRTKAAMLSHVTSPSGLVLPMHRIVPELERRGVRTIIDGAHGVGFLDLDVGALGCSFYTSNCHKWLCTPKGSAFLFVRADLQADFRPLVLSNHAERPKSGRRHLHTEFDYVGTDDYSAVMCIPRAIEVVGGLVGGWDRVRAHNRDLCLRARRHLCAVLDIEPPAPESMIAALATLPLPPARPGEAPALYHDALQERLIRRHAIQVPVWTAPAGSSNRAFRISAQLYNSMGQYEYLARALAEELAIEARG
ncbi:MAG: aminotransferase class V-fold PLP-dependent enzyme [Phycisphaerae bacterium]|nr:aminotransferase class V-fold PLP-dependent enzyme [Phycisphaerae bacterium]